MQEEQQRQRAGLERDLQVGSRRCCCCCRCRWHVTAAVCVPSMHFLAELQLNALLSTAIPHLPALPCPQLAIMDGKEATQLKIEALEQLEKATEVGDRSLSVVYAHAQGGSGEGGRLPSWLVRRSACPTWRCPWWPRYAALQEAAALHLQLRAQVQEAQAAALATTEREQVGRALLSPSPSTHNPSSTMLLTCCCSLPAAAFGCAGRRGGCAGRAGQGAGRGAGRHPHPAARAGALPARLLLLLRHSLLLLFP